MGNCSNLCKVDFPFEWLTRIFALNYVEHFTLHYYNPTTIITRLGLLLYKIVSLTRLKLSFRKLHISDIFEQI